MAERIKFLREVCEMALAHALKDKAKAAYRRDLFEKRREVMHVSCFPLVA